MGRPLFDRLTPRQQEIAEKVMQGLSNQEIAEELGIGKPSVKNHVVDIFDTIGCDNRVQAAVWLSREQWEEENALLATP